MNDPVTTWRFDEREIAAAGDEFKKCKLQRQGRHRRTAGRVAFASGRSEMRIAAFTAFALLGIAGCSGVDPTSLKAAPGSRSISLSTPYTYEEHYRVAGTTMVHTLAAGKYAARFEDDGGTYFDGPEKCFLITARFDSPEVAARNKGYEPKSFRCGIYVPTRAGEMPKVYFYQADDAPVTTTTVQPLNPAKPPPSQVMLGTAAGYGVVDAIIAAERKNLHFNRDQPKDDSLKRALSTP